MTIFDTLYLSVYPLLPFALGKLGPGLHERMGNVIIKRFNRKLVLFHAASVGETNTVKPIIQESRKLWTDVDYTISTITEQGRLNGLRILHENVLRAPLDLSPVVDRFYQKVRPSLLVLVEQELWPNLILRAKCPVALVAGRMSERSYKRYSSLNYLFKKVFAKLDLVAAQTEEYRERFLRLGVPKEKIHISGSLKFDSLPNIDEQAARKEMRERFRLGNNFTFLAASTHEPEEVAVLEAFQHLQKNGAKLIIAPRHISRVNQIKSLVEAKGFKCYKSSEQVIENGVILVDKIGELYKLYAACDVAFVGGSLANRGGHNILEPASLGKPILTGPSLYNFSFAAKPLEQMGIVRIVKNSKELANELKMTNLSSLGEKAREYVKRNRGASAVTCKLLTSLLKDGI